MILKQLALKFPSWFIAGAIFLGSTLVFVVWWAMSGNNKGGQTKTEPAVTSAPATPSFDISDVVLCGNTLVNFKTGKILAREWLEGFGARSPNIVKLFPDEKLALVVGDRSMVQAFGFDGKAKPMLQVDGKPVGSAAYCPTAPEVVYVRDGNLFHGKTNWHDSRVESSRKVTDTGYFRPDTFEGRWLWRPNRLVVESLGKTLSISLVEGGVKEGRVDLAQLQQGMNSGGEFALVRGQGRELLVVDMLNGEAKKYPVPQVISGFLWLTNDKAALQLGRNEIGLYDHKQKKIQSLGKSDEPINEICKPSPDGSCFLVVERSKIVVVDTDSNKTYHLKFPLNQAEWISNDQMIGSNSAAATDSRGVWLVKKTGEAEQLSNQPVDSLRSNGASPSGITKIADGGLFVSGGNLWLCSISPGRVKKITNGEKLPPALKLLNSTGAMPSQ